MIDSASWMQLQQNPHQLSSMEAWRRSAVRKLRRLLREAGTGANWTDPHQKGQNEQIQGTGRGRSRAEGASWPDMRKGKRGHQKKDQRRRAQEPKKTNWHMVATPTGVWRQWSQVYMQLQEKTPNPHPLGLLSFQKPSYFHLTYL